MPELVAYHEAEHALMALVLGGDVRLAMGKEVAASLRSLPTAE